MDFREIVEAVKGLEPGDTGSWSAPTCKRTFPFHNVQALEAHLAAIDRPISQVSVYHKPQGGGFVAYIQMLN